MTTNKTTDEATSVREPGRATVGIVFAGVTANALTQFAIQAYMSYRFAKDVWEIPRLLCGGVIVALDLFAVMFMVFTYLLRQARWWTQLYVWAVFAAGVGAQLFAAELYGAHMKWSGPVRIFAALPALFLAASLHGLIIWRNHATSSTKLTPPSPAVTRRSVRLADLVDGEINDGPCTYRVWDSAGVCIYAGASSELRARLGQHQHDEADWLELATMVTQEIHESMGVALDVERAIIQTDRPRFNRQHNLDVQAGALPVKAYGGREKRLRATRKPNSAAPAKRGRSGHPDRDLAVRRVHAGEDTATVAIDLGVSRRAVQIWVRDAENAASSGRPVIPEPLASVFTQTDPEPVNGFSFGAATEAQVN